VRETVTLTGGFAVSLEALKLAWALEERGFRVRLAEDGGLLVSPRSRLTAQDDDAIRWHRRELIDLARYCEGTQ
jgi:hypothetical protein